MRNERVCITNHLTNGKTLQGRVKSYNNDPREQANRLLSSLMIVMMAHHGHWSELQMHAALQKSKIRLNKMWVITYEKNRFAKETKVLI